jgi:CheY-like chemotaxis protein
MVLNCMDDYMLSQQEADTDTGTDTWPSVLEATGAHMFVEPAGKRILLADADDSSRMYLRSKLASLGMMQIDEARDRLQAKALLENSPTGAQAYDAVIIDLDLPGGGAWGLLTHAPSARLKLAIQQPLSLTHRLTAKMQGVQAMSKPLDPSRLNELLNQL